MECSPADMARNIRAKKRKLTETLDQETNGTNPQLQGSQHTPAGQEGHDHADCHSETAGRSDTAQNSQAQCQQEGGSHRSLPSQVHNPYKKPRPAPAHSAALHAETGNTPGQETEDHHHAHQAAAPPVPAPAGGLNLFRSASRSQMMRHVASLNNAWRNALVPTDPVQIAEDHDVLSEFDLEISMAVTRVGGHVLGLNQSPDRLMESPGIRKLVARNLAWFHASSDFCKLVALLAAKKVNRILEARLFVPEHPLAPPHAEDSTVKKENEVIVCGSNAVQFCALASD